MRNRKISGKEFILRLLGGEHDFSNVQIENFDFDMNPLAGEARQCMRSMDWKKYPLILTGASLYGFNATGLALPYIKADYITMNNCRISESNFEEGTFYGSKIIKCTFVDDNFKCARFSLLDQKNDAKPIGAAIPGTTIFGSDLTAAKCQGLTGDSKTKILHCTAGAIKLNYSNLTGFDFTGTSMPFADIYGAIVTLARFKNADFTYKGENGEITGGLKNLDYALGIDLADFSGAKMTPETRKKLERAVKCAKMEDFSNRIIYAGAKPSGKELESITDKEITSLLDILEK